MNSPAVVEVSSNAVTPKTSAKIIPFKKTPKQVEACEALNNHTHTLLFGGSRSGKTTIIVRNIILRALKKPSRHLIARFRFNHAKASLWYDTIPKVLRMCFPGVRYTENKSDWFITLHLGTDPETGEDRGESQLWLGGVDDKDRVEKILGNEYSTIYLNECSQIEYDAVTMLRTRLAENTGLKLRFYYDCNPPGKKHWTYVEFVEKLIPKTKEPSKLTSTGYILLNPKDNMANLPQEYMDILESLPERQRQRFLEGKFLSDIEGALWTDQQLSDARMKEGGVIIKTIIAIDPAVTNNPDSDETGIIACSLDENQDGIVHEDQSGKCSTLTWANRAVNMYYKYDANFIVAETNQGGDLVVDAIKNIDPNIKVVTVHASKGKFARAEPVQQLYEQGKIRHDDTFPDLDAELTEWVPEDTSESPNRLDALVWGLSYLMIKKTARKVRAMVIGAGTNEQQDDPHHYERV